MNGLYSFLFSIFVLFLGCTTAYAGAVQEGQTVFLYNGKKVSPICLRKMISFEDEADEVDIGNCENDAEIKSIKILEKNDGTLEAQYKFKKAEFFSPSISYRIIGKNGQGVIAIVFSSGGGSGQLSNVMVLRVVGNKLVKVDEISGGDRCNFGISKAEVVNGEIVVHKSVTEADFVGLIYNKRITQEMLKSLESVPLGCFAEAVYINKKFSGVILDDFHSSKKESPQENLSECLDKIYNEQAKTNTHLDVEEYKNFMDTFLMTCSTNGG